GSCRDDVGGGGAGAAQVWVDDVENALVVGVGVDGGHQRLLDAEAVVDNLGGGGEAVGGAGGVGDDVVLGWVIRVLVDAEHDGDVLAFGRRGDDHLLDAVAQVGPGFVRIGEEAGALDHDLSA